MLKPLVYLCILSLCLGCHIIEKSRKQQLRSSPIPTVVNFKGLDEGSCLAAGHIFDQSLQVCRQVTERDCLERNQLLFLNGCSNPIPNILELADTLNLKSHCQANAFGALTECRDYEVSLAPDGHAELDLKQTIHFVGKIELTVKSNGGEEQILDLSKYSQLVSFRNQTQEASFTLAIKFAPDAIIQSESKLSFDKPINPIDKFAKIVADAIKKAGDEKWLNSRAVWSQRLNSVPITGGPGDDFYVVDSGDDLIQEEADQGTDTVTASVDYTLPDNIENLVLTGFASSATGNALRNVLTANDRGNWLDGGENSDTLIGGKGNDFLLGGLGADFMRGGAGDDVYFVDEVGDQIAEDSSAGFDSVIVSTDHTLSDNVENLSWMDAGSGKGVSLGGNSLNNTVMGSIYDDVLSGLDGDDVLSGLEGDDIVFGGAGDDVIDDSVGNNKLYGGDGNDFITGAGLLVGGPGNDILVGPSDSNDTYVFNLGDGSDEIQDAMGDDVLAFGSGIGPTALATEKVGLDLIFWVSAKDQVTVKDWFQAGTQKIESIRFDDGTEWDDADVLSVLINHSPKVSAKIPDMITGINEPIDMSLRAAFVDVEDDGELSFSVTRADGQPLPDWLSVNNTTQQLNGIPTGADVGTYLLQLTATDHTGASASSLFQMTIFDNAGDDVVVATTATELISGGPGHDTIYARDGKDMLLGGTGNDEIYSGHGDDTLLGGDGDDMLYGEPGDDILDGGGGNDSLFGGSGNNIYLFGRGDGYDSIWAGVDGSTPGTLNTLQFKDGVRPSDIIVARSTDDNSKSLRLWIADTSDQVVVRMFFNNTNNPYSPENGIQQIKFMDGTTWDIPTLVAMTLVGTDGFDDIQGTAGADTIMGQDANDRLSGYAGNDTLEGGAGIDSLFGGDGDDTLLGGDGNDLLYGEDGDDILDGGLGSDGLVGGKGNNTYLFGRGDGYDPIWGGGADSTPGKLNILQFKDGVRPSDVIAKRIIDEDKHQSLELQIIGTSDRTVVRMFFKDNNPYNPENGIQQIRFMDGTTWDIPTIVALTHAKELFSLTAHITCWGPGRDINMIGSAMEIAMAVVSAANSPEADCHNGPYPNNLYSFGRQDGATLYFDCKSWNDCGGRSIDSFSLTLTKVDIVGMPVLPGSDPQNFLATDPRKPSELRTGRSHQIQTLPASAVSRIVRKNDEPLIKRNIPGIVVRAL